MIIAPPIETPVDPCNPSPCGANAICKSRNGAGSCVCLPEYYGDPYTGCRPECVTNSDCDRSKACLNNKCRDPCPGTCGLNAECRVVNHSPSCFCLPGYAGNPITACHPVPASKHQLQLYLFCLCHFIVWKESVDYLLWNERFIQGFDLSKKAHLFG